MMPDLIVLAWYRREDYDQIFALAPGGGGMEPTFDDWQKFVKRAIPGIEARGIPIKKIIVKPGEFAAWLRKNNLQSSPEARAKYAFEIAGKRFGTH
jgi:hypothetical protein